MIKVQRQSRGLLALLGAVGAQSPSDMNSQIAGVIDLTYLMSAGAAFGTFLANAAAVSGTILSAVVPANEHWLLLQSESLLSGKALATYANHAIDISLDGRNATYAYGEFQAPGVGVAGALHQVTFIPPFPLMLSPGSQVRARVGGLVGVANITLNLRLTAFRFAS